MEILREGNCPDQFYIGTCRKCGCKIRVRKHEVKIGYSGIDSMPGDFVKCPTDGCDRTIDVKPEGK